MIRARKVVFFWFPTLIWMGLIYLLSSFHKLQASPVGWQDFLVRKAAHFLEYAVLYLFYYRGLKNTVNISIWKYLSIALVLTVLYALTDEFHQTKVSGRTGKLTDIGIDSLGAIGGLLFVVKLAKFLPERFRKIITIEL